MEIFRELGGVGASRFIGVADLLAAEKHRQQRARAIDASRLIVFRERVAQPRFEPRTGSFELGYELVSLSMRSVSRPARTESGFPDSVPAW